VLLQKLRYALLGLGLMLVLSTTGYMLIEGWSAFDSLWMVIITLTTIGYGEVHPLSNAGRAFTLAMITVGFGLVTYTFAQLTRYVVEGGLRHDLVERRRRIRMERLEDHVIVVGYGRLGREVGDELISRGVPACVIEQKEEVAEEIPPPAVSICGDGAHDDILLKAGIERARGIAIATPQSTTNVYLTLAARQLAPSISIVTRVDDPDAIEKARRAGADRLVQPYGVGGTRMAHALIHPESSAFVENVITRHDRNLELQDVPVGAEARAWHGSLRELSVRQRSGVLVVAIRRDDGTFLTAPDPETQVGPGDVLVVVGRPEDVKRFKGAVG